MNKSLSIILITYSTILKPVLLAEVFTKKQESDLLSTANNHNFTEADKNKSSAIKFNTAKEALRALQDTFKEPNPAYFAPFAYSITKSSLNDKDKLALLSNLSIHADENNIPESKWLDFY